VRCLAFSPTGEHLATGHYDRSIRLWDLRGGKPGRLLGRGSSTPQSLTWAPDGSRVFWLAGTTGAVLATATAGGRTTPLGGRRRGAFAFGICLSPDGRTLYVAGERVIFRWNLVRDVKRPSWRTASPHCLAVSPDGKTLASTHPHSELSWVTPHVALWDTATGRRRARLLDCTEVCDGVAFSPDGSRLAALGHQTLWLWELPAGRPLAHHPSRKFYTGLAYSPDGRVLATSNNDGVVRFWDGRTGAPLRAFAWDIGKVLCVGFAPDGMRAAAGGERGTIIAWDVD
jgi:WD40 repeat protein